MIEYIINGVDTASIIRIEAIIVRKIPAALIAKGEKMAKKNYMAKAFPFIMWAVTLLWIALVYFLSSQTGARTTALSLRLATFLGRIFQISPGELPAFHASLRSAAHVAVYFVLGLCACASVRLSFPQKRFVWLYIIVICSLFAVLDEVRKAYIPGRHCSYFEAGLNIAGVVAGVAFVLFLQKVFRSRAPNGPQP